MEGVGTKEPGVEEEGYVSEGGKLSDLQSCPVSPQLWINKQPEAAHNSWPVSRNRPCGTRGATLCRLSLLAIAWSESSHFLVGRVLQHHLAQYTHIIDE